MLRYIIATHMFVTMLSSHGPVSLLFTKAAVILTKRPNWEQVAIIGIIEEKGAVEASNVFLHQNTSTVRKLDGP
jgi:hypothetical protein